jgi:inhibitor of cysteine peptidase
VQIEISEAQNGNSVAVCVDDVLLLQLPENSSSGYRWTLGDLDDARLALEDSSYRAADESVGGGGYAVWTLRALSPGTTCVEAKLWRSWEGERSTRQRFSLGVEIKPRRHEN